MTRIARWLGRGALALMLLYGFLVLGTALWLRQQLTPNGLATSTACWGSRDSMARDARSQRHRDSLVLYVVSHTFAAETWHGPGRLLRSAAIYHVYRTWWPAVERDRLFAYTTPRLRRCGQPPPGWPWNKA